jgi:hypothetical protein
MESIFTAIFRSAETAKRISTRLIDKQINGCYIEFDYTGNQWLVKKWGIVQGRAKLLKEACEIATDGKLSFKGKV